MLTALHGAFYQVRNLINCHKSTGDFEAMGLAEQLLAAERVGPAQSLPRIPCPMAPQSEHALLQMLQAMMRQRAEEGAS